MSDLSERIAFLSEWEGKLCKARDARTHPTHTPALAQELDRALDQIRIARGILTERAFDRGDADAIRLLTPAERSQGNRIAVEQVKAIHQSLR